MSILDRGGLRLHSCLRRGYLPRPAGRTSIVPDPRVQTNYSHTRTSIFDCSRSSRRRSCSSITARPSASSTCAAFVKVAICGRRRKPDAISGDSLHDRFVAVAAGIVRAGIAAVGSREAALRQLSGLCSFSRMTVWLRKQFDPDSDRGYAPRPMPASWWNSEPDRDIPRRSSENQHQRSRRASGCGCGNPLEGSNVPSAELRIAARVGMPVTEIQHAPEGFATNTGYLRFMERLVRAEAIRPVPRALARTGDGGNNWFIGGTAPIPEQYPARLHVLGTLRLFQKEVFGARREPSLHTLSPIAHLAPCVNRQANLVKQWRDRLAFIIAQGDVKNVPVHRRVPTC